MNPLGTMQISDFDFDLPEGLIAQQPLERRSDSRMLVVDRKARTWHDDKFANFPSFIEAGDSLVVNNTRVFPARLVGIREPSGGQVELFLIRQLNTGAWETLARPAKKLRVGTRVNFGDGRLCGEVVGTLGEGHREVLFNEGKPFESLLEEIGQTPLPPYIKREGAPSVEDRERYQTVYAQHRGAIAAPTAGLHFTTSILDHVKALGAEIVEITLHVGYGTFEPVRVDDLRRHSVTPESYEINSAAAAAINRTKERKGRVIAIGTTTTRALESATDMNGKVHPRLGTADLTIIPGYKFRAVDALLTNFHLPKSSLLVLVSTFAGRDLILNAYEHAVNERYRFYSYGDCMFIV
jgi:S-adenosylmethionine:tRNA ribosyltransferase-isomerase